MKTLLLSSAIAVLAFDSVVAEMPEGVRNHINEHFIGEHDIVMTFEGVTTKGTSTWEWGPGGEFCVLLCHKFDDGSVANFMSGWDNTTQTFRETGFHSDGTNSVISWSVFTPGKWTGTVTGNGLDGKIGTYVATSEFKDGGFVYKESNGLVFKATKKK